MNIMTQMPFRHCPNGQSSIYNLGNLEVKSVQQNLHNGCETCQMSNDSRVQQLVDEILDEHAPKEVCADCLPVPQGLGMNCAYRS